MPNDKKRSLRALDALNPSNAGILTGLGPFLSIFYTAARRWDPARVGLLLAWPNRGWVRWSTKPETKGLRRLSPLGIVTICVISVVAFENYVLQLAVQLIFGLAMTVIPAATSAFALGLSDARQVSGRVARNETLEHTGNLAFALLAGIAGAFETFSGSSFWQPSSPEGWQCRSYSSKRKT